MNATFIECLEYGKVDKAAALRVHELEGNALKGEEVLAEALKGAASALGKTDKADVRHFGSAGTRAVVVEEKDPET